MTLIDFICNFNSIIVCFYLYSKYNYMQHIHNFFNYLKQPNNYKKKFLYYVLSILYNEVIQFFLRLLIFVVLKI